MTMGWWLAQVRLRTYDVLRNTWHWHNTFQHSRNSRRATAEPTEIMILFNGARRSHSVQFKLQLILWRANTFSTFYRFYQYIVRLQVYKSLLSPVSTCCVVLWCRMPCRMPYNLQLASCNSDCHYFNYSHSQSWCLNKVCDLLFNKFRSEFIVVLTLQSDAEVTTECSYGPTSYPVFCPFIVRIGIFEIEEVVILFYRRSSASQRNLDPIFMC